MDPNDPNTLYESADNNGLLQTIDIESALSAERLFFILSQQPGGFRRVVSISSENGDSLFFL